jgi:hypothetical protein
MVYTPVQAQMPWVFFHQRFLGSCANAHQGTLHFKGNNIKKRNNLADTERLKRDQRRKKEDQEKLDLEVKVKTEQELAKGKGKAIPPAEPPKLSSDSSSKDSSAIALEVSLCTRVTIK